MLVLIVLVIDVLLTVEVGGVLLLLGVELEGVEVETEVLEDVAVELEVETVPVEELVVTVLEIEEELFGVHPPAAL